MLNLVVQPSYSISSLSACTHRRVYWICISAYWLLALLFTKAANSCIFIWKWYIYVWVYCFLLLLVLQKFLLGRKLTFCLHKALYYFQRYFSPYPEKYVEMSITSKCYCTVEVPCSAYSGYSGINYFFSSAFMWLNFLGGRKKEFFAYRVLSKILALWSRLIAMSSICKCMVLAITAGYEKPKVKQWGNFGGENMPCMSQFLFQHLSAGPSSKLVWAQRKALGKAPKISAPREMIESRERECTRSLNRSPCPKVGLFISASATPVSYLSNLFLKKWHRQFPPFLRQSFLGTGLYFLGPCVCPSLQQFWGNAIPTLTFCG